MEALRQAQNQENAARQLLSEAATAYERAGTQLAADKVYLSAAEAYEHALRCSSSPDAFLLRKAAQKCREQKAPKVTPLVLAEKRAAIAAQLDPLEAAVEQQRIAELYEKEDRSEQAAEEFTAAANLHKSAAVLYKSAACEAASLHCWERAAHHLADMEEFGVAALLFERLASHQPDLCSAATSRFHAVSSRFHAVLCHLANGDYESAQHLIPETFAGLTLAKAVLLNTLAAQIQHFDEMQFTEAMIAYDDAEEMDTWISRLFYAAERQFKRQMK
jgi:tetratricopeptide (TPR) repeat protein